MDLPKVKKQLWDLLPRPENLAGKAKEVGAGLVMVTIGAFASPAQPALPTTEPSSLSVKKDQPADKLILQQPSSPLRTHAQHESHSSHSSHYSHQSHYSHYSRSE